MATASVSISNSFHGIDDFVLLITWDSHDTALIASFLSDVLNDNVNSIPNLDGYMDGKTSFIIPLFLFLSDNDANYFFFCTAPVLVLRKSMLTACIHSYCKHKRFYFVLSN